MTDILQNFTTVAVALGGYEGIKWLVTFIANRKQQKRIAESEADLKETEAGLKETEIVAANFHIYVDRIEELRNANAELNKINLGLIKEGAHKDEIITDKTLMIRKLQEELLNATRRIGILERLVQYYKTWFCKREYGREKGSCCRREPAQNPPQKFLPLPAELSAITDMPNASVD